VVTVCSSGVTGAAVRDLHAACAVLKLFNEANLRTSLISHSEFYNDAINKEIDIRALRYNEEGRSLTTDQGFAFLNFPFLFDAESKSRLLTIENNAIQSSMLRETVMMHMMGNRINPYLILEVSRDNIIEDALTQLVYNETDLRKPLKVKFLFEEGIDEGGLSKEFFQLMTKALFDPHFGMFRFDEDNNYYWFNPNTFESNENFELIGTILGLAMYNNVILDAHFPMALYRKLAGYSVGVEDFRAMNTTMYEGLEQLLKFDGNVQETYCRTFQVDTEAFGEIITHDLKENGFSIPVTNDNRQEYVDLYIDWYLNKSIETYFSHLKTGFLKVCDGAIIRMLHPAELENLICGNPDLDFMELEKITEYDNGYTRQSPTIL
jgi:hypothetical protein